MSPPLTARPYVEGPQKTKQQTKENNQPSQKTNPHLPTMPEKTAVDCLNDLGLHEEALKAVARDLQTRQDKETLWQAVTTALRNKSYNLAAEYADRLKTAPGIRKMHLQIISLAYNFAGRHDDAYLTCREAVDQDRSYFKSDRYSLACRATCIDRNEEAFLHITAALSCLRPGDRYLVRKAFLDSELAGAWDYAATHEPDLEKALTVYFPEWEEFVEANRPVEPERSVDHRDLTRMPGEFHRLLRSQCAATFYSPPFAAAREPELYGRYLEWQAETAKPRVDAFARYMRKVNKSLDDSQPHFAAFQAERQRFGAARIHINRILWKIPNSNPARLPNIPLMEPLIDEFKAQYKESPWTFNFLIHRRHPGLSPEEFASLPPINRRSGTAALLLGNGHYLEDRNEEAIRAWSECAKIWPWDATPLLNMVKLLVQTDRPQEAAKVLSTIRPHAISAELRTKLERNIAESDWVEDVFNKRCEIPLPEFCEFYPGANEEFLETQRESPATQPLNS